jgi:hypothetical protein
MWRMRKMTQSRKEVARQAELALAETLKKVRAEIERHIDVGEGAPPVPKKVFYQVCDLVEVLDLATADLTGDRDDEVEAAIDDLGR